VDGFDYGELGVDPTLDPELVRIGRPKALLLLLAGILLLGGSCPVQLHCSTTLGADCTRSQG
jgi:hypothetical protein